MAFHYSPFDIRNLLLYYKCIRINLPDLILQFAHFKFSHYGIQNIDLFFFCISALALVNGYPTFHIVNEELFDLVFFL